MSWKVLKFHLFLPKVLERYWNFIQLLPSYKEVWNIFKIVFVLSHGQASIERGFSVNKHLLVENLKTQSLIALRRIENHMSSSGKTPYDIEITKDMLRHTKEASRRYRDSLECQRKERNEDQKKLETKDP